MPGLSGLELLAILRNLTERRKKLYKKTTALPTAHAHDGPSYRRGLSFLARIHALLDENMANVNFDIQLICKELSMSRPQLYRKFTAVADIPIGKYILTYRLHKAREMLETGNKNVTEASIETGFKSVSHFSSAFKKEFGYSPKELITWIAWFR